MSPIVRPGMSLLSLFVCLLAVGIVAPACLGPGGFEPEQDSQPVVYGSDDRVDVYAYPDQAWADQVSGFTAALMSPGDIDTSNPNDVQFAGQTLQVAYDLCAGERFLNQPTTAWCSGTLIAPDLVLTAGHCVTSQNDCNNTRFVFGYEMTDANNLATVTTGDIYACDQLVVQTYSATVDYAIVRLDRPANGRTPASIATAADAVPDGTGLLMHGYPSGIPTKLEPGGSVRDSRGGTLDYFVSNSDSFGGNSGSGVFSQATQQLVGVLVRGETDYVRQGSCYVVNQCSDVGCRGEDSTYAFRAAEDYCATVGSGYFCNCGNGTCDGGEDSVSCPQDCGSQCGDGVCNGGETPVDCPEDCGTCPNAICEPEEANAGDCCTDCGCGGALVCVDNQCVPDPGAGDDCGDPIQVPASGTQVVNADTSSAYDSTQGSCGVSGTGSGPDRVFTFTIPTEHDVSIEAEGFDTVLYVRSVCDQPNTEIDCNDDADPPGQYGSHLDLANLAPGTYYVFLDGYDPDDDGSATVTFIFTDLNPCPDADGDGTCDADDGCPNDPGKIDPGQCGCGVADTDTDGDGTADCNDNCPDDPNKTEPGACGCGVADTDSDSDGTPDCNDNCPDDPNKTEPGACGCGVADTDSDGDGTPNCNDNCPDDPNKTDPGACGCGVADTDSDGDGTPNCNDNCPDDPAKIEPGTCGCGVSDADTDNDGTADCDDGCPADPDKTEPGLCGCGEPEGCDDLCPDDPDKSSPGVCGCGVPDVDTDGDGSMDCEDGCPNDPDKTVPGACGCGVPEDACGDQCPDDPDKTEPGECGCGVPDVDSDADGVLDCEDGCPNDPAKSEPGLCGCGEPEGCEDQCPDDPEKSNPGVCGCGVPDVDTDVDGTLDCEDGCPADPAKTEPGQCGCGVAEGTCGDDLCPDDPDKTEPGECGCGTPEGQCSSGSAGCGCAATRGDGSLGLLLVLGLMGLALRGRRRQPN